MATPAGAERPGIGLRRWARATTALVGLVGAAAFGQACAEPLRSDAAKQRLARMQAAALERNYQGTMVVSSRGLVSSSRVAHYSVGAQSFEFIESLDGRQQLVLRQNELVHTLWPRDGVVVVERREGADPRALLLQTVDAWLLEQYELRLEGRQRVAGHDAEVMMLAPRDDLRYAQRLWADVDSGLMLKAEVLGRGREVLESSGFSSIEINVKPQPERVLQPLRKLSQFRQLRAQQERTRLEDEGWTMARPLPGFRLVGAVRRPLEAVPDGADGKPPERMVQAVFSDGLTHVSLFVERFDDKRHRNEIQAVIGATSTRTQRRGEYWLTAMGDVPIATLGQLFECIERRP